MTNNSITNLIKELMKLASDKKGENICCYDLTDKGWISEYILVIGAKNTIHCKALLEEVSLKYKKILKNKSSSDFYDIPKVNGKSESGWVILDLNSVICHFITNDCREFYDIDRHLKDKTQIILH